MPKKILGYISAYIKKPGLKNQYPRIGTLFMDTEDGRYSMKIDSVPVDSAWDGWCNVFPPNSRPKTAKENADEFAPAPTTEAGDSEEDVPF